MDPWDRQHGETWKDWQLFLHYLHSETRVKSRTAEANGLSPSRIYVISKREKWDARTTAYDNHLQEKEDEVVLGELESATREHIKAVRSMRALGMRTIQRVLENSEDGDVPPTEIREALSLVKDSINLERLILGEATVRTETQSWDLSGLTPEEIRQLRELKAKAGVSQ